MFHLGDFVFGVDDLPEVLSFKYKLKNTILRLSDGSRFLQEFGAEVDSITWKGTFRYTDSAGASAVDRAKAVKDMFLARRPVQFACDVYATQATITDLDIDIKNFAEVDYAITLYVSTPTAYTLRNSRLDSVYSSLSHATNAAVASGVPGTTTGSATVTNAFHVAGLHPQ